MTTLKKNKQYRINFAASDMGGGRMLKAYSQTGKVTKLTKTHVYYTDPTMPGRPFVASIVDIESAFPIA